MCKPVVALFMAVVVTALLVIPSGAQTQADRSGERELLLILDASGSMARTDANGVRLIDGAKQALLALVDTLPDDVQVGLRVYGHRYPSTDQTNGCTDTELIVPIGELDRARLADEIGRFDALGYTPIGLSLNEAVDDFSPENETRAIVLVSDGEDTCAPPDPCEVARDLFESGVFVRVETVGLVLDDTAARDQLQCIAEATGGSYHDIASIEVLAQELGAIADDAIGGPEGLLFGGLAKETATALHTCCRPDAPPADAEGAWPVESGDYRIPIVQGQTLWFSLELQDLQGSNLVATLTVPSGAGAEGYLELNVLDDDGHHLAADREGFGPRRSLLAERPTVWATMLNVTELTGDPGPPPLWGGRKYVTITWEAKPAQVAGEIVLTVETLEAHGDYAVFVTTEREKSERPAEDLLLGGATRAAAAEIPTAFAAEIGPGEHADETHGIQLEPGEVVWYRFQLQGLQEASVGVHSFHVPGVASPPGQIDLRLFDEDETELGTDLQDLSSNQFVWASTGAVDAGSYYARVAWDVTDGEMGAAEQMVAEAGLGLTVDQSGPIGDDDTGQATPDDPADEADESADQISSDPTPTETVGENASDPGSGSALLIVLATAGVGLAGIIVLLALRRRQ